MTRLYRHLSWFNNNMRPWVCHWNENFGSRPIKDATMRRLIKKGLFPYTGKTFNKRYKGEFNATISI